MQKLSGYCLETTAFLVGNEAARESRCNPAGFTGTAGHHASGFLSCRCLVNKCVPGHRVCPSSELWVTSVCRADCRRDTEVTRGRWGAGRELPRQLLRTWSRHNCDRKSQCRRKPGWMGSRPGFSVEIDWKRKKKEKTQKTNNNLTSLPADK